VRLRAPPARIRSLQRASSVRWRGARAVGVLGAGLALAAPAPSWAASKTQTDLRRLAIYVESGTAEVARGAIERGLPSEIEVSDAKQFAAALKKTGRLPLGNVSDAAAVGRRVGKACKTVKIDAAVVVVTETKPKRNAHVLLFRCGQEQPLQDEHVPLEAKRDANRDARAIASAVTPQVKELAPAPAAAPAVQSPEPGEEEAEEEAPAETEPAARPAKPKGDGADEAEAPSPKEGGVERSFLSHHVSLGLFGGFTGRRFGYHQRLTPVRRYSIGGFPTIGGLAQAFPFASQEGALRGLGLGLSYSRALPFDSASDGSAKVKTYFSTLDAGLRYRIQLGSRAALSILPSFGFEDFTFVGAGALSSEVASVRYRYIRGALEGRIPIGPLGLIVSAGYRLVLSGGQVADRFPHAGIGGMDARLGAAIPLGKSGLEFMAFGRYDRYFYSMHSKPGDTNVAGGATDQFFGGDLGLSFGF
jgi:hypothetical protein